ncbi:hypothetical protein DUNSADRAFT_17314 [Dunaliella salina]|uniref:Encoded protein n=1 Tax=Dunaliella salina TaxID=3046 RepID=A0ABQ7G204_DUNSA|nr:hypothetical protein DUNSADRAFT_17314 [Dunaliella salina]|eukprot:KAF5828625.1 hypothetical protein DUNSADRAFT_17314 [Dunaliella salina]
MGRQQEQEGARPRQGPLHTKEVEVLQTNPNPQQSLHLLDGSVPPKQACWLHFGRHAGAFSRACAFLMTLSDEFVASKVADTLVALRQTRRSLH